MNTTQQQKELRLKLVSLLVDRQQGKPVQHEIDKVKRLIVHGYKIDMGGPVASTTNPIGK